MTFENIFFGEVLGTMALIMIGNGICSVSTYKNSKGYTNKAGWLTISIGWGLGVWFGVLVANIFGTGGHLNPAVTIANMVAGTKYGGVTIGHGFFYIFSELLGACIGQIIVNTVWWSQIKDSEPGDVLSCHSTGSVTPKRWFNNFFAEFVATCLLIATALIAVKYMNIAKPLINFIGPFTVAAVVVTAVLCLGATTGAAINPARDAAPRFIYTLMYRFAPGLKNKTYNSDWKYCLTVPVPATICAAFVIGGLDHLTFAV